MRTSWLSRRLRRSVTSCSRASVTRWTKRSACTSSTRPTTGRSTVAGSRTRRSARSSARRSGWSPSEDADFAHYLRRVYHRPYDNNTLIYHKHMDQVIRFEHLQEDFALTLARLGLEQVRPLPLVNKTGERGTYLDYYPPDLRPHAAKIFGPYMLKWGYALPADWVGVTIPRSAIAYFQLRGIGRYIARRYLRRPGQPRDQDGRGRVDAALANSGATPGSLKRGLDVRLSRCDQGRPGAPGPRPPRGHGRRPSPAPPGPPKMAASRPRRVAPRSARRRPRVSRCRR